MARKKPPAAGEEVSIRDGDSVGSIAVQYGHFAWKASVWDHPRNEALKDKRLDPHLLSPGDTLFVPPLEEKEVDAGSEARHRFRLRRDRDCLRLRLLDAIGEPVIDAEYELRVEFSDSTERFQQVGTKTDFDGVIEEKIPCSTTKAVLKFKATGDEIELNIGRLEPLDRDNDTVQRKAVQQRLQSLGFFAGAIDGAASPEFESAVRAFQQFCRTSAAAGGSAPDAGDPDGRLTPEVMAAMKDYFGC